MTTPHQGSPDGAVTIGGGEWKYGQLVNENRAREQFELEPPSNLAEALDLLPTVLHTIPHEGMRSWQRWLGATDDEVKDGTVVQKIMDSLDKHPLRKLKNRLFHGLNGDDDPDDDPTDTDIYNAALGLNTGVAGVLEDATDLIAAGSNAIKNALFERGLSSQPTQGIFSNDFSYSGGRSLKMTSDGAGKSYTLLSSGLTPQTMLALGGDQFYVEVMVYGAPTNVQNTGGANGIRFCMSPSTNTGAALADQYVSLTASTALNGVWTKLSGFLTMPPNTHKVEPKLQLSTAVANGSIFYFDSAIVREVTLAKEAQTTADSATTTANTANTTAGTANTNASNAVTTAGNAQTAANTANTTANTANTNAGTAQTTADGAKQATYDIIESGSNIVKNSNFERGNAFTGGTFVSSPAFSGSSSLRLIATGSLLSYPLHTDGLTPQTANAKEGDVFLLEVMVYGAVTNTQTTGGTSGIKFSMSPISRTGTVLAKQWVALTASTALNGAWTKLTGVVTMPADAVKAYVYLELDTAVTSGQIYYFDQAVCREVTVAKAAETTAIDAQALGDDIVASGSNVIKNFDFERGTSVQPSQGVFSTDITAFSGTKTLKMTSNGAGKDYALMTAGITPKSTPSNEGDIFYVEAMVWGASTNTQTTGGTAAIRLNIEPTTRLGATLTNQYVSLTAGTPLKNTWTKMSGYVTMPATTARAKISLQLTSAVTNNDIYYWDNIIVREVTVAKAAKDDVQTVVDATVQAVDGGSAIGAAPTQVKTKLQLAWANLWDGMNGSSGNTVKTPAEVQNRAASIFSRTGATETVTGTTTTNLQTTVDAVAQAVNGGTATGAAHATVKTNLQKAWGNIFDGLSGNAVNTTAAATPAQVHTASKTVKDTTRDTIDAIVNASDGSSTANNAPATVKTKLQAAWGNIFDGLQGNAVNTTAVATPAQVHTAGKTVKDTTRDTLDIIVQAVDGTTGVQNNTPATAKTKLQLAWANLFDGLNGTTGSTVKTPADVKTAATTFRSSHTTLIDNITSGWMGDTVVGATLANALDSMKNSRKDLEDNTKAIQLLRSNKNAAAAKGSMYSVDFAKFATPTAAGFTVYPTGDLSNTIVVSNGVAQWNVVNSNSSDAMLLYNQSTATDFQSVRGVMSAPPQAPNGATPYFYAIARVSPDRQNYVFARAYATAFGVYRADVGYTTSGPAGETLFANGSSLSLTWSLDMRFVAGVGTNERQFQVWSGDKVVGNTVTDPTNASQLCSLGHLTAAAHTTACTKYRGWGAIAQVRNQKVAGKVSGCSASDNGTPSVNGSTARMHRASTSSVLFTANSITPLPANFFDTVPFESLDIDGDTANGTFKVSISKPYNIVARVAMTSPGVTSVCTLILQKSINNGSSWTDVQWGDDVYASNNEAMRGNWLQYLNAGEMVRIAYNRGGITSTILTGESTGAKTYFAITGFDLDASV